MPSSHLRVALMAAALAPVLALPFAAPAHAVETIVLTLSGNKFSPDQVKAPAGERFRIEVRNQDKTPAEFESTDMHIEKIVVPGGTITVNAGPLKPGTYKFFDEYHPDTANGVLTAEAR